MAGRQINLLSVLLSQDERDFIVYGNLYLSDVVDDLLMRLESLKPTLSLKHESKQKFNKLLQMRSPLRHSVYLQYTEEVQSDIADILDYLRMSLADEEEKQKEHSASYNNATITLGIIMLMSNKCIENINTLNSKSETAHITLIKPDLVMASIHTLSKSLFLRLSNTTEQSFIEQISWSIDNSLSRIVPLIRDYHKTGQIPLKSLQRNA